MYISEALILSKFKIILSLLLILAVALAGCSAPQDEPVSSIVVDVQQVEVEPPEPPEPVVTSVRFSATGDNLIHTGIYLQAAKREGNGGYDFSYCYDEVRYFYEDFDVNWLNQETLINDVLPPSSYPMFSTPGQMGFDLYDVGFNVFSLSNNHTYDKGTVGLSGTMDFWATMPEDSFITGLYASEDEYLSAITYQTVNDITIAYLAYTETTNGLPQPHDAPYHVIYTSQTDIIQAQITHAAENSDIVVVGNHWGVENSHTTTQPQKELAQQMADWGADLIIGTHPHVVQDAQWLKAADGRDVFIAYSLGNFLNAQAVPATMVGLILSCEFEKTTSPEGVVSTRVLAPQLTPVINHYESGYNNIRVYMFSEYTAELAAVHGVRNGFSVPYITELLNKHVSDEFLVMPQV